MAKTTFRTWVTGETVTAAQLNEQIRDNGNEIWKGTTNGDIDYYTSSTTKSRLAIGSTAQTLKTIGGVPAWSNGIACQITNNTATISSASQTELTSYNSELYDSSAFYPGTGGVITIPTGYGGMYIFGGYGTWQQNAVVDKVRRIGIKINSNLWIQNTSGQDNANTDIYQTVTGMYQLNDGDAISMSVYQNSGSSLTFTAYGLWIYKIA